MNEKLLHYIWKYRLFNQSNLYTIDDQKIHILHPGHHNQNQGPDFLHARIRINKIEWVGNIELHVKSSDWNHHKHSDDDNYKNVILHVVWIHDKSIDISFPTLQLQDITSKLLLHKYQNLTEKKKFIPCENIKPDLNDLLLLKLKERLVIERLQQKASQLQNSLEKLNFDWLELFWRLICRNFGGKINADAFEKIACNTPIKVLIKIQPDLFQIEAILFGQAGLLSHHHPDEYQRKLGKEYVFLKNKFSINKPRININYLRMNPNAFPTIRISQLAMFIHSNANDFLNILNHDNLDEIIKCFRIGTSDYWNTHYIFNKKSRFKKKYTGVEFINTIIINTIVIMKFLIEKNRNDSSYVENSINFLEKTKAESNLIIKEFQKNKLISKNAFDSQAYIQLKKEYCDHLGCLDCMIGKQIFKI